MADADNQQSVLVAWTSKAIPPCRGITALSAVIHGVALTLSTSVLEIAPVPSARMTHAVGIDMKASAIAPAVSRSIGGSPAAIALL